MFIYDALGLLFLIVTGAFLLSCPLIVVGVLVWVFEKTKTMIKVHRGAN